MIKNILFALIMIIPFFSHASNIYKQKDKNLIINGKKYEDVFRDEMLTWSYLGKFNGENAIKIQGSNNQNAYLTFNKDKPDKIGCVYLEYKMTESGFMNRNALCGLSLNIEDAIYNYEKIVSKISLGPNNFRLPPKKNGQRGYANFKKLSVELYKDKSLSVQVKYNDGKSFDDGKPVVLVKKENKKVFEKSNYFIVYRMQGRTYKLDHILFLNKGSKKYNVFKIKSAPEILMTCPQSQTMFSCQLGNSKYVSFCEIDKSIEYRYGSLRKDELIVNQKDNPIYSKSNKINGHITKNYVYFNRGKFSYTLLEEINEENYTTSYINQGDDTYFYPVWSGDNNIKYTLTVNRSDKKIFEQSCKRVDNELDYFYFRNMNDK